MRRKNSKTNRMERTRMPKKRKNKKTKLALDSVRHRRDSSRKQSTQSVEMQTRWTRTANRERKKT